MNKQLSVWNEDYTVMDKARPILFVSVEGKIAGAETSLLSLLERLRPHLVISLACPAAGTLSAEAAEMNVECHDITDCSRLQSISLTGVMVLLKTIYSLLKVFGRTKPAVIHANNFLAVVACLIPSIITRKHLVWHARDFSRRHRLVRMCGYFCKHIIAVSDSVKEALVSTGVSPQKISVVYNGIDEEALHDSKLIETNFRITQHAQEEPFLFANIGQFVPWKKQSLFICAAETVSRQCSNARFILVGDDVFGRDREYKEELLAEITRSEVSAKISCTGWMEKMEGIWAKIDCLVHTADREPFGRVIIEAMAHKIPVIAVNCAGPAEIILNGETGILVDANNVGDLSEAMVKMIHDRRLGNELATRGFEYVRLNLTSDLTAQRIRNLYLEILAA